MSNTINEKKTNNIEWWIDLILFIMLLHAIGALILMYFDGSNQSEKGDFQYLFPLVLLCICVLASLSLQAVFHELGHLIFGLLSGYRFSSFRSII